MEGGWTWNDSDAPPATLCDALAAASHEHQTGYTFLGDDGTNEQMSYARLAELVQQRAQALRALGLAEGDRVAIILDDNRQFVVTFFAAIWAKFVPVPMYPPMALGRLDAYLDTAASIAQSAGATAIVTSERLRMLLWPVASRATSVRLVVTSNQLDDGPRDTSAPPRVEPDDLAFLQFTSGSTAAPKGVMVTHRCLIANTRAILQALITGPPHEVCGLSWLPLYHDMGLIGFVIAPLYCRRPAVLMSPLGFLVRPERWFQALHDHKATITFAPNFAYAISVKRVTREQMARWDLSHVRVFGCGAEPIRAETLRAFADHFASAGVRSTSLVPCYGMAEATLAVTYHPLGSPLRVETVDAERLAREQRALPARDARTSLEVVSCGRPLPGHDVRIVNEQGTTLSDRIVGEIEARGPSVAAGYVGDDEATRATFVDGWLRTGDLGFLSEGELFVAGRKKDLIIVAGRNYAPEQIEASAARVSGVRPGNVVAFARPGNRGTEDVVVVCESASLDQPGLVEAVRARVAEEVGLSLSEVLIVGPGMLPKTSSGKLQRSRARMLFLEHKLERHGERSPRGGARALLLARHFVTSTWSRARFLLRSSRWNHPKP
jgi:fatty-acyl-CoA synthase